LRSQLIGKIAEISSKDPELKDELERIIDDFFSDLSSTYLDFLNTLEEDLANTEAKPAKPQRKKKEPSEKPDKPAFVKPTNVQKMLNDNGLRISKDAKPKLMELLNETIKKDIDRLKDQLPSFQKGDHEGEKKRVTLKSDDISWEKLAAPMPSSLASDSLPAAASASCAVVPSASSIHVVLKETDQEIDSIPLDQVDARYRLALVVKQAKG